MKKRNPSIGKRLKSFSYAFNGLKILIREEPNSKIHLCVAGCVVVFGWLMHISVIEWIALCFAIGLVFTLEIINTAIENIADFISPEWNDAIKRIKDIAAAAVLVGAMFAVIVGVLIFLPKVLCLLHLNY